MLQIIAICHLNIKEIFNFNLLLFARLRCVGANQMNESSGGKPDAEEDCDKLHESDTVARSQDVQVLKNVWN